MYSQLREGLVYFPPGYRDAQCGWLLVNETLPPSQTRSGKRETMGAEGKKAQCLCIYASRRGIVEVSSFCVGLGVIQRLLY